MSPKRFKAKNGTHAECGAAALEGWSDVYPDAALNDELSNLGDMIADIMHYARREGFDPIPILRMAEHHYEEES
jgi:hypothetical protein